jgi:hypothetical protein
MSSERKSVINGVNMFFIGLTVGSIMHLVFDFIIERNKNVLYIGILGTIQIALIIYVIDLFNSQVPDLGFFVTGLLVSQDMVIRHLLVNGRPKK